MLVAMVLAVTFAMPQSIEDLTAILSGTPELTVTEPESGFPVIEVQTPVSAALLLSTERRFSLGLRPITHRFYM